MDFNVLNVYCKCLISKNRQNKRKNRQNKEKNRQNKEKNRQNDDKCLKSAAMIALLYLVKEISAILEPR